MAIPVGSQPGLYRGFENAPPLYLVHGEQKAQKALVETLRDAFSAPVTIASRGQKIEIGPAVT